MDDVITIARKLLNRSVVSRLIPKQECMVELDKLPLVLSTESIESISLSGSYKLTSDSHKGLIARYRKVATDRPDLSLSGLFEEEKEARATKKTIIPHWIGGRGQPTYPVTHDYARMTLLVHKPWGAPSPLHSNQWEPFTTQIDGERMKINASMAKGDQQEVLLTVMSKVKEWVECATTPDVNKARTFKPLYLTVQGCAGSGKSFFVKCLVNTVREIFGNKNVAHVVGPTGAAAWSVGGQTMHRKFAISPHSPSSEPSEKQKENMKNDNRLALIYILDERSMYTADNLGASERNLAATAHGGGHEGEVFGGVPIFILIGDDYQLPPPTNTQKGAFDVLGGKPSLSQQKTGVAASGAQLFLDLSKTCMALKTIKRQKNDQKKLINILGRMRLGESTPADAQDLMQYHLANFSNTEVETITKTGTTMHLFAFKKSKNEFNYRKLQAVSSATNPVALVKTRWESTAGKPKVCKAHFPNLPVNATIVSRGAMVSISNHNFEPEWGLFNNSVGEVEEIVFNKGDNPNAGDHPCYIAVSFPQYSGPAWDAEKPKVCSNQRLHLNHFCSHVVKKITALK